MLPTVLLFFLGLLATGIGCLAVFAFVVARWAERRVPPCGRFVTAAGVRLHYLDRGEGPVILMIHGLASQLQTFTYALADLLPGYRVVMLDRPGAGYSQAGPAAGLGAQARVIAAFLHELGIDRALVVGHSLGGAIALALAVDHPSCVAGLVLIAPATQHVDEPPDMLRPLAIRSDLVRWLIGWTLMIPSSLRTGKDRVAALFAPDPAPLDFATRGGALLPLRPWTFRAASRDLVMGGGDLASYAARHRDIAVPVGCVFGTADGVLDHRHHGERLHLAGARVDLTLIPNAGHMLPLSHPKDCAASIDRMATRIGWTAAPTRGEIAR